MKKLNFDSLFDWLDEEEVTKPKPKSRKREPTSVPQAVSGKNTRDGSESTSRSKSVAVKPKEVGIKIATSKTSEQQKLFTVGKSFPSKKIRKTHVVQRQKATAKTKSDGNGKVEEWLDNASAYNRYLLQLDSEDSEDEGPKKKRNNTVRVAPTAGSRVKFTRTNKALQAKPKKQTIKSADKALAAASVKGRRMQEKRRRRQQQHSMLLEQKRIQKQIEMKIRSTPLNGNCKWSFDLLPDLPLKHVASYLPAVSRVLFDIALHGNVLSSINDNSRGVAGYPPTLDFGEIEISLAKKLRDKDLKAILQRIDAVHNLKRLNLMNCFEITGVGLEPLRGSIVIEQIDVSILREYGAYTDLPRPQILVSDHVEPILDSIIAQEGCALKHLQFPKMSKPSIEFNNRYNEMLRLRNRRRDCFKCNRIHPYGGFSRGVQCNTCCGCLNHFCGFCRNGKQMLYARLCHGCERYYCLDCATITHCDDCDKYFCTTCEENFTDCCIPECARKFCSDCTSNSTCDNCERSWCQRCSTGRNVQLCDVGMNSKILHCTKCLFCATCDRHADTDCLCECCSQYYCRRCFVDYDRPQEDGCMDVCAACKEDGRGYRYCERREREMRLEDDGAFTTAPTIYRVV